MSERSVPIFDGRRDVHISEAGAATLERQDWNARVAVPDGEVTFLVTLTGRSRNGAPQGTKPLERSWTQRKIDNAIAWEIEMMLVSPPPKEAGDKLAFDLTAYALYSANGQLKRQARRRPPFRRAATA